MTEIDQAAPKGNGIAQHSSESNEHYTPRIIIEVAREAMGSIELDPASCEIANRENVRAKRFFTKEDDGLSRPWDAKTIFVNPPGGKLKLVAGKWVPVAKGPGKSSAQIWWGKAIDEWIADPEPFSKTIVFLGFTLELMRLSQLMKPSVIGVPFCVLRERTDFLVERELTNGGSVLVAQGDPTHANVLACITQSRDVAMRFRSICLSRLGEATIPSETVLR